MTKRALKMTTVFFALVWLAVVVSAVVLSFAGYGQYGFARYIVLFMAGFMLLLFGIAFLPRNKSARPVTANLGLWATGLLIAAVICMLVFSMLKGYKILGPLGVAVLAFFAVIFSRILIDFVKDARKKGREKPPRKRPVKTSDCPGKSPDKK